MPQVQSPALKIRKISACTAKLEKLRQEDYLIIMLKADLGNRVKPHSHSAEIRGRDFVVQLICKHTAVNLGHICPHVSWLLSIATYGPEMRTDRPP